MISETKQEKIDAIALAQYILKHYGPMSHLKLQKLLFYCDAYCLAFFGKELIEDSFEAWVHGPVCRKVFELLKGASVLYTDMYYSPIPGMNEDELFGQLPLDIQDLLKEVLDNLSKWNGIELERATHSEEPWQKARIGYGEADKCHVHISKELTRSFYRQQQGLNG